VNAFIILNPEHYIPGFVVSPFVAGNIEQIGLVSAGCGCHGVVWCGVNLFSIAWEGGRVCPPGRSDGAGALAHPERQAHGGCLAHLLGGAPVGDGSSLQALALGIGVAHQDHAGVLEELLLGHDRFGC